MIAISQQGLRIFLYFGSHGTALVVYHLFSWIAVITLPTIGLNKNLAPAAAVFCACPIVYLIWAPLNAQIRETGLLLFIKVGTVSSLLLYALTTLFDYFRS